MARERRIKPTIFKNEILGVADPIYTLLFEGLWVLADREGRLVDRAMRIKAEIFPYRDMPDFDANLEWLQEQGFIVRYQVAGERYIQIVNFRKHQKVHPNETPSVIPEYKEVAETSTNGASPSTIGESPQTLNSFPSLPSLNSLPSWIDGAGTRVHPLTQQQETDFEKALNGIKSDLGILQLTRESDWVLMLERAFTNKFTPEHIVEVHSLLRKQKWRNNAVTPKILEENLTELEKLRRQAKQDGNGQNGTTSIGESSEDIARRIGADAEF